MSCHVHVHARVHVRHSVCVPASQYVEVIGHLHEDHTVQEFKTTELGDSFGEATKPRPKPGVFRSSDLMKHAVLPRWTL